MLADEIENLGARHFTHLSGKALAAGKLRYRTGG